MGKFNYKKWVIDHKYSKKPSLIKEDDETVAGVTLPSTKSETQLIKFLRQLIIDIQDGKYSKDASPSEIDNLDDLIILVLNAMADGNITSIIQRLEEMVAKKIDTDAGAEDETDGGSFADKFKQDHDVQKWLDATN